MYVEIIDDNTLLSNHIRKYFEKEWDSVGLYNSRHDFLHHCKFQADMYIMDINLWDGNGIDLIEHIRVVEEIKVPIIIVSGQTNSQVRREWLEKWANGFIEKPFTIKELHEKINGILYHIECEKEWKCDLTHRHKSLYLSKNEQDKIFKAL